MLAHRLAEAATIEPSANAIHAIGSETALCELLGRSTLGVQSAHYRAVLMQIRADTDLARITATLQHEFGIEVIDQLDAQIQELCRIRRPREKLRREELEWHARQICPAHARVQFGVWAFYPWSRRLVHLVDEKQFVELRTNRNLYKISPAEQTLLRNKRVGIIGASAGQAVALAIATERGCGELRIADFDQLDASNLNRVRGGVHQLAVAKVVVAAREVAEMDPFLNVRCFTQGVTEHNVDLFLEDGGKLDLVVEESDSLDIKFLVRERARKRRIPVLMDSSDRGLLDVERFDLEPSRPLFHGLAPDLDARALRSLTTEEKIPHMLDLLGVENISDRLKASMLEIDQTIPTWPQLASSVFMGGAIAADTARRILLGEHIASGRYYVDLQQLIPGRAKAAQPSRSAAGGRIQYSNAQLHQAIDVLPPEQAAMTLDRELVTALVAAGISAPSGGNAQPWRWAYGRGALLLLRDSAQTSFLDTEGHGSLAALGAAAENVCLAAASRGMRARCEAFPLGNEHLPVAGFRFFAQHTNDLPNGDLELAAQIFERRTDRRLGKREPLPAAAVSAMRAAIAQIPGARMEVVSETRDLAQLEHILGVTQQLLLQHAPAHRQMMSEVQWDDPDAPASDCGIPLQSLALSALDRAALDICRSSAVLELNKSWGGGTGLRKFAAKAVRASSAVALLSMPEGTAHACFQGGRAMQRAWLAACAHKLALHPMSALPYLFARSRSDPASLPEWFAQSLADLWPSYARLFNVSEREAGVLLFRLAQPVGATPPAAPRRPISHVLRFF